MMIEKDNGFKSGSHIMDDQQIGGHGEGLLRNNHISSTTASPKLGTNEEI